MKKKVLIVDDNEANLYLLKHILEDENFDAIEARNGQDALDKAYAEMPDMIVSDILMPVMDGYTLCKQCKSDARLRHIPFVFYTATYTESKDHQFALSLGADRFVIKPQEPEILINILKEFWEGLPVSEPSEPRPLGSEMEYFRQYNEILFKKLEKKMLDLAKTNSRLKCLEEQYRLSFENVTDVVWTIDADLTIQKMSPSVEKMLGYRPQDLIGRSVPDLAKIVAPEAVERAMTEIGLVLRGKTIPASVYQFIARDGTVRYAETSGSPILREGKIVGMVSVIRDITDRKRAEDELRKSEARFRSYFELPLIGIAITSPEKGWLEGNNRLSEILGYSWQELKHMTWSELTYPDDLPADVKQFNRLLAGEIDSYMMDKRFVRKNGEVIWISLAAGCVRKQNGTADYFVALFEDITDRKESIERMRKSLEATVQAMAVTVETRDPYTAGHQRRVAALAWTIASEMGLANDQIEGIRMAAVIHDIGKISVPAEILSMPRKLTEIELTLIKTHARSGYDILKDIEFPWPIARIVLEHHERMDGSGYPNQLTGENILIESRVLSVADVVEAMASHRPYRPSVGLNVALEEIAKNRGTLYDAKVVDACLRLFKEKGYQFPE